MPAEHKPSHSRTFGRQRRLMLSSSLGLAVTPLSLLDANATSYSELRLNLYNLHTAEHLNLVFWENGNYNIESLRRINNLLRDHRTGGIIPIDPRLLSIVYLVNKKINNNHPISVISGYRSIETNRMLAKTNTGVAKNSYHTKGQAIDLRIEGADTKEIRDAALSLRVGGVGYYEKSNFVHLDTGPRRSWLS